MKSKKDKCLFLCANRREFLLLSGVSTAAIALSGIPGLGGKKVEAVTTGYPKKKIGSISSLELNTPVLFDYPDNNKFSECLLVKLGVEAGGGVGHKKDIVAFSNFCTHMGANMLDGGYSAPDRAIGPCSYHGSVFDLTRHGINVSGHGTESLAQVLLEVDGNEIYAKGMMGLIYGRHSNLIE